MLLLSTDCRQARHVSGLSRIYMLSKAVSLKERFSEYVKRVQPVVLYGDGSWTWCRRTLNRLIAWENNHLRRIVGARHQRDET